MAIIGFYGLSLDYLDHYAENIEKVTAADIKAAFARHVDLKRLVTVLVSLGCEHTHFLLDRSRHHRHYGREHDCEDQVQHHRQRRAGDEGAPQLVNIANVKNNYKLARI